MDISKRKRQKATTKTLKKVSSESTGKTNSYANSNSYSNVNSSRITLFNTREKKNTFITMQDVPLVTVFKYFLHGELKHRPTEEEMKMYVLVREEKPHHHLDLTKTISGNGLKSGDFLACMSSQ